MNREEILSMAKEESDARQCDEREKKVFDKFLCIFASFL